LSGKSKADVISKLAIVEEEADETSYWMELLVESQIVQPSRVTELLRETNEIIAMTVASIRTLREQIPRRRTCIADKVGGCLLSKIQNPKLIWAREF
jgi:hypothetical protein